MDHRIAEIERSTLETQIKLKIDLDGQGKTAFVSVVPFRDHMLDQMAKHVENSHHIAETIFKALGRALRMAVAHDPRMLGIMPSTHQR